MKGEDDSVCEMVEDAAHKGRQAWDIGQQEHDGFIRSEIFL